MSANLVARRRLLLVGVHGGPPLHLLGSGGAGFVARMEWISGRVSPPPLLSPLQGLLASQVAQFHYPRINEGLGTAGTVVLLYGG
jgi:hypothetical protein